MHTAEDLVSLGNIGSGAAIEMFDNELQKVLDNLDDPNKACSEARTITLTVTLKPGEAHGIVSVGIAVKAKLAGQKTFPTNLLMGNKGGKVEARELIQAQQPLKFGENVIAIDEKTDKS